MRTITSLLLAGTVALALSAPALGYGVDGHRNITKAAFGLLEATEPAAYSALATPGGACPEVQAMRKRDSGFRELGVAEAIIAETPAVDDYRDIEFVDVEGGFGDGGRDNPHKFELNAINDKTQTGRGDMSFTAFNHFIDIRKGAGAFDDFDGYSYRKGSGSKDERQKAESLAQWWGEKITAQITGFKVDEAVNWWFNDAYVHVPGQEWYKSCSPAMERYCYYQDAGRFKSQKEEFAARFPLANSTGARNKGVPYSVFMPIDNLARYWYGRYAETRDPLALAPVLHAVQDASIPHHAAGCMGNWHSEYEAEVDSKTTAWVADEAFTSTVKSLVADWSLPDLSPSAKLAVSDWSRRPSIDWRLDQLVTWVALNAYEEYRGTNGGFKDGYKLNETSARKLAGLAEAMTVLILKKAARDGMQGDYTTTINVPGMPTGDSVIPVSARAGESFTIRIVSNHTTGYQWRVAGSPDPKVVVCTGSTYEAPAESVPGKAGAEVWAFRAVGEGRVKLTLEYVRPFEANTGKPTVQVFDLTVTPRKD